VSLESDEREICCTIVLIKTKIKKEIKICVCLLRFVALGQRHNKTYPSSYRKTEVLAHIGLPWWTCKNCQTSWSVPVIDRRTKYLKSCTATELTLGYK